MKYSANGIAARFLVSGMVLILLVLLAETDLSAKSLWKRITPQKFDRKVALKIAEKNRIYYLLREGSEIQVSISGPTKLRVTSRGEIPSSKDEYRCTYLARLDDGDWKKYSQRSGVSSQAEFVRETSAKVSASKAHVFKIPEGAHTYTFKLPEKSTRRALLRFHRREGDFGGPVDEVGMTPQVASESVDLVVREKVTIYYRLGHGDEIAIRLIGPATLRLLARLEFDKNMQGQQNFRVQVFEDDSLKGTYPLTAVQSDICQYKKPSNLVPAKAETFYLDIPQGEHEYRFILPENQRTVLLKFLLPKKDLTGKP